MYHVVLLQKADPDSSWKGHKVKASEIVEVYDATGELHSYIVNLTIDKQPAGFVEIGNNSEDFPVLSYSFEYSRMNSEEVNNFSTKSQNKNKDKKVKSKKVVTVGPGKFGLKVDYNDNSADIVSYDGITNISSVDNKTKEKVAKQKKSESKVIWGKIKKIDCGEIGSTTDGVTDSLDFEIGYTGRTKGYVNGVGDSNQWTSSLWTGPSGCSPTSAYNVFYYWKYTKSKTSLIGDTNQTMLALRTAMGTYYDSATGGCATPEGNIGPGMVTVAKNCGYSTATQSTHNNPSWTTIKNDIVGPSVISFWSQTYYCPNGAHTVTGIGNVEFFYNNSTSSTGHQYLIIHDNWSSTPTDVYIAYGRNYTRIHSVKFSI